MNPTSLTVSLVPEAKGGPFILWDPLPVACQKARALGYEDNEDYILTMVVNILFHEDEDGDLRPSYDAVIGWNSSQFDLPILSAKSGDGERDDEHRSK